MLILYIVLLLLSLLGMTVFGAQPILCVPALVMGAAGLLLCLRKKEKKTFVRFLLFAGAAALLLVGGVRTNPASPAAYAARVQSIQRLLSANRLDDAAQAITELEESDGEGDQSRLLWAQCYILNEEYDTALSWLARVETKDEAYYTAAIYCLAGKSDKAAGSLSEDREKLKELVREAARAIPDNPDFNRLAGSACMDDFAYKQAVYFYGQAYFTDRDSAQAAFDLGNAYYYLGDAAQAAHFLEIARDRHPGDDLGAQINDLLEKVEVTR